MLPSPFDEDEVDMLVSCLIVWSLGVVAPAQAPAPSEPVVLASQPASRPLADGDQGIGRGVRNMVVGAGFAAVGLVLTTVATAVFMTGFASAYLVTTFLPALATLLAPSLATGGGLLAVALALVGSALLVGGVVWFGFNALLVIIRLNPDYKPSPGTEYLEMNYQPSTP